MSKKKKKKMQIELQQHRLQSRKTKFLLADCLLAFPPRISTSYIPSLPVITMMSIILSNLEKKKKAASKGFPYFSFRNAQDESLAFSS